MKELRTIKVSEDIFYKYLELHEPDVRLVDDIYPYIHGYYEDRHYIYYNGKDEFITLEYSINYYTKLYKTVTSWKQVRVKLSTNTEGDSEASVSGTKAYAEMNKLLLKHYTKREIDERLHMFEADYDKDLIQFHYFAEVEFNRVEKFTNTYKYDINGAHLDALCEIFPKARESLEDMYKKRKKNPVFKQYPNLYVGMLAKKTPEMRKNHIPGEYERTYNWIVQRTTKKLFEAINYTGGMLLYANTDGFIVKDVKRTLNTSKKLGDFKLEHQGDTYIYYTDNYFIYQTGDKKFGSCFNSVRDDIDLSTGSVVKYETYSNEYYKKPINIEKVEVEIHEN